MRLPLAEMVRRSIPNARRKKITLPAIEPTATQAATLGNAYAGVLRLWAAYIRERIIPAYRRTLEQEQSRLQRDSVQDIQIAVSGGEGYALQAVVKFGQQTSEWATELERWHLRKVVGSIKYATNIDLSTMLGNQEAASTVEQAIARNVALVRDVSDTVRSKMTNIVFAGVASRTPVRDMAKQINEVMQVQKARSLRIASDQTVKLSAQLDRERMEQLGIDRFEWMHSRKAHPRKEHVARNGLVYKWKDPRIAGDLPGHAPFCGCKAKGVLVLDEAAVEAEPTPEPIALPAPPVETAEKRNARLGKEQKSYVLKNGKKTGTEFLTNYDMETGEILGRSDGSKNFVSFPPSLVAAISDPARKISLHHNHPSSSSFSGQDLFMLNEYEGMREIWAYGHNGSSYLAKRKGPAASLADRLKLRKEHEAVANELVEKLRKNAPPDADQQTEKDINSIFWHLVSEIMRRRGYIEYEYELKGETLEAGNRLTNLVYKVMKDYPK